MLIDFKFKAKSLRTKKWVYGFYINIEMIRACIAQIQGEELVLAEVDIKTVCLWVNMVDNKSEDLYINDTLEITIDGEVYDATLEMQEYGLWLEFDDSERSGYIANMPDFRDWHIVITGNLFGK